METMETINFETHDVKIVDAALEGAVLIRSSRSGTTQNFRLPDGRLVETYECKSGKIMVQEIKTPNQSLTVDYFPSEPH